LISGPCRDFFILFVRQSFEKEWKATNVLHAPVIRRGSGDDEQRAPEGMSALA
jgi:hypothetical protein